MRNDILLAINMQMQFEAQHKNYKQIADYITNVAPHYTQYYATILYPNSHLFHLGNKPDKNSIPCDIITSVPYDDKASKILVKNTFLLPEDTINTNFKDAEIYLVGCDILSILLVANSLFEDDISFHIICEYIDDSILTKHEITRFLTRCFPEQVIN